MGDFLFVFRIKLYGAGRLALFEGFFVAHQDIVGLLGSFVSASLCLFLHFLDAAFDGFEIFQLEFSINDFLVAHGIHRSIDMGHVLIVKTTEHMDDSVCLADVGQELVAQPFAFAGTFHQTGDVYDFNGSGDDTSRMHQLCQFGEAFIGYGDDAYIRFDGTERKVGRLCLCV